jgi:uncharacterized membrane protein YphA (DoxX/SURF4 family)
MVRPRERYPAERYRRPRRAPPTPTDKATAVVRTFLGLVFVTSGLNGFIHFLPAFSVTGQGANFIDALVNSYFWPLLKVAELIVGGALLFNVFAQFAIFLLAPVTLGILWFHTFLSPPGAWFAWTLLGAEIALVVLFRKQLKRVFMPSDKVDEGKVVHDDNLERV